MSAPDDDARVHELVCACLERLEHEGPRVLAELHDHHPAHAARVLSRLRALADAGLVDLGGPIHNDTWPERLGDFRLDRRIASGGMGVVFEAWQLSVGRRVALKIVRPELLYFPNARERFRREVEAVARLSHPGIVSVHAVGDEAGVPYLAMEFVEGLSLAEALEALAGRAPDTLTGADLAALVAQRAPGTDTPSGARRDAFAGTWIATCIALVAEVAESVEHAHERGVLHRDLKPSNVLVRRSGRAVIVDFGLANVTGASRLTRTGSQMGSLPYMPPEALRGDVRELGPAADVYALGVTLYELCTLRLPYEGESAAALERAMRAAPPPAMRRLHAGVPRDLETVCRKAIELEPTRRYASASDFAQDLRRVLEHRPVHARRVGPLGRAHRFARRRPALSAALLLASTIAVGAPLAWRALRSEFDDEAARATSARELASGHFELALRTAELVLQRGGEAPLTELLAALEGALGAHAALDAGVDEEQRAQHEHRLRRLIGRIFVQLGRRARSSETHRALVETCRARVDLAGPPSPWGYALIEALEPWFDDLLIGGRAEEALEAVLEIERVTDWLATSPEREAALAVHRIAIDANRAQALVRLGRPAEARIGFARALERLAQLPPDPELQDAKRLQHEASIRASLAPLELQAGDLASARESWLRARVLCEEALRIEPGNVQLEYERALSARDLGRALAIAGEHEEADAELALAAELFDALVRAHPETAEYRLRQVEIEDGRAIAAQRRGDFEASRAGFARAIEAAQALVARHPDDRAYHHLLVVSSANAAVIERHAGSIVEARALYERAEAALAELLRFGAFSAPDVERFAWLPLEHASCCTALGEPERAGPLLERASAMGARDAELWHQIAREWSLAGAHQADLADADGRPWEALALDALRRALELGWSNAHELERDEAWAPLRELAEFEELIASARRAGER